MKRIIPCELITWVEIQRLAGRLAQAIQRANYQPDIVVAIARGGYIPARLICDLLDIHHLASLQVIHYTAGIQQVKTPRLTGHLSVNVKGCKVLIIDDLTETGDTLRIALDHVRSLDPADVKIATLHHKTVSPIEPDFYARKIVKWRWLGYPWARLEDTTGFIAAMEPPPESMAEAKARLAKEHGMKVSQSILEKAYSRVSKRNTTLKGRRGCERKYSK